MKRPAYGLAWRGLALGSRTALRSLRTTHRVQQVQHAQPQQDFSRVIITFAGISGSPIALLVQFNGRLLNSVVGSKFENKFLITFSLFF